MGRVMRLAHCGLVLALGLLVGTARGDEVALTRLTEAVAKNPHAVLLLDEAEKAHEDVFNILLQVMDHGTLTDTNGKPTDFRHVILLMTSNVGARELASAPSALPKAARSETSTRPPTPTARSRSCSRPSSGTAWTPGCASTRCPPR